MINQQVLSGQWNELAGQIREKWGDLTDQELQQVRGNGQQLLGLIQRKTGESREAIERQLDELVKDEDSLLSRASASTREAAVQASESVRQGYEQVSESIRHGVDDAGKVVREHPMESLAVAFGSGLIAGVIIGLVARSR